MKKLFETLLSLLLLLTTATASSADQCKTLLGSSEATNTPHINRVFNEQPFSQGEEDQIFDLLGNITLVLQKQRTQEEAVQYPNSLSAPFTIVRRFAEIYDDGDKIKVFLDNLRGLAAQLNIPTDQISPAYLPPLAMVSAQEVWQSIFNQLSQSDTFTLLTLLLTLEVYVSQHEGYTFLLSARELSDTIQLVITQETTNYFNWDSKLLTAIAKSITETISLSSQANQSASDLSSVDTNTAEKSTADEDIFAGTSELTLALQQLKLEDYQQSPAVFWGNKMPLLNHLASEAKANPELPKLILEKVRQSIQDSELPEFLERYMVSSAHLIPLSSLNDEDSLKRFFSGLLDHAGMQGMWHVVAVFQNIPNPDALTDPAKRLITNTFINNEWPAIID